MLSIKLLGSPAVLLDGAPVRGFVSGKAAALIYYLAATGRPHAREALAGLLWPEAADAQAHKNLRDVLSNLRRLLGDYLDVTRQAVALPIDERVTVDSRRFEADVQAASPARLREALAAYAGDFLDGFSLADAPAFEEWALVERERLRQLALGSMQRLAAHAGHAGDYHEAIGFLTRLLALDPTREEAHRQLMLLLALDGQRGAALAQYQACRRMLDEELGIEPDEATEALHRRILDGSVVDDQIRRPASVPILPVYHLPAALAAPIGRAVETERVLELLRDRASRLVTITGHGGAGKTCLALHAAHLLASASQRGEAFASGVAFVGLAPVELAGGDQPNEEEAALPILSTRVGDALRFTFAGAEPPLDQLAASLREKELLLVLDNCEHLPAAGFVVALLERAPRIAILVTSRGRLNVSGEQIVELEGLAFPNGRQAAAPTAPDDYSAVQLFRRAAQAVSPRTAWTPEVGAAAARICRLVAGLPLAIELAASLVRLMPIEEIEREIAANLEFLQSSRRDLPERHQSLRAVFDHSWRLLRPAEQRALRQMSIFRDGFSRAAAAEVAGATLPLLTALVDNSLVRRAPDRDQEAGRYELLELVHRYAAERLAAARPDEQAATAERHGRYYLGLLCARGADLRAARQQPAAEELYREIENIRAAWRWAVEQGQVELIGTSAESLFFFYEMRSWFREGVEVFARAAGRLAEVASGGSSPLARAVWGKLLAYQGWCAFQIGRQAEAQALLNQSLAILRTLARDVELALPLCYLAALAYYSGDYADSERLAGEALRISQACGNQHGAAVALTVFGQVAALVGRYEDARRYSEASLAVERELGNRWGMAFPLISLGKVAQTMGAHRQARRYFEEGLAIRQAFGDTRGVALCMRYLGAAAEALADYAASDRYYREALALFQSIGNQAGVVETLAELGYNALAQHEPAAAASHFHSALRVAWQSASTPRILEALVGMAASLAGEQPRRAIELAALARDHSAATQAIRDRAEVILSRLVLNAPNDAGSEHNLPATGRLETMVQALLREDV